MTVKLLNGQAVCHMLQGKYGDAEDLLMEALERARARARVRSRARSLTPPGSRHEVGVPPSQSNGDAETLINLAVCAQNTGKGLDVVNRYIGYVVARRARRTSSGWRLTRACASSWQCGRRPLGQATARQRPAPPVPGRH